jgi:hypothetical protein
MAIIQLNSQLRGATGRIGNLVYRNVNGRTIVCKRPTASRSKPTEAQLAHRALFREACNYAKFVCANPERREAYEVSVAKHAVYKTAVRDYMRGPQVTRIIDAEYEGHVGNQIRVYATDDTRVTRVRVTLRDVHGVEIESGAARDVGSYWSYHAKTDVAPGRTVFIEAQAEDMARNAHAAGAEV